MMMAGILCEDGRSIMECPQCSAEIGDGDWNCPSCRINVYWATQHYDELVRIREERGLDRTSTSPSFLVASHKQAMGERKNVGVDKVRAVAKKVMRRQS